MRLHNFILENMESILLQWDDFARDVWPDESSSIPDLRDHAQEMLHAVCIELQTTQTDRERHDKSVGNGSSSAESEKIDEVSAEHAAQRLESGFDVRALVAEYRALRASVLHMWGQAVPVMDENQVQDITRFGECMDQLLEESVHSYSDSIEHSRQLLLGILGHDLRSPLSAVSMIAGLLVERAELNDSSRQMASLIVVGAREMKRLVDDLLDFAGSQLGVKMQISRQPMNLQDLCHEVTAEIQAAYPECAINVECGGEANGEWDRPRLRQLISNLLANSVQHGLAGAPIRMVIKPDGNVVELAVCNQGPPIPTTLQAAMFDPLCRNVCNGSVREMGGLGLGLYIAREVANAHDGSIEVHSDEKETSFIVKLPQSHTSETEGDAETAADAPL